MKPVTSADLLDIKFVSGVSLNENGTLAAFLLAVQNEEENRYESGIFTLDTKTMEVRRLTAGKGEFAFVWDGNDTILFPADREKTALQPGEKTVFYRISVNGGEAEKAFELPLDVQAVKRLSSGLWAVLACEDLGRPPSGATQREKDDYGLYHVLEEIPFWANARGFISRLRRRLHVYDEASGELRLISPQMFDVDGFDADASRLLYWGDDFDKVRSRKSIARICAHDGSGGAELLEPGRFGVSGGALTIDGAFLILNSHEPWGLCQDSKAYLWRSGAELLEVPFPDGAVLGHSSVMTDCAYGSGTGMLFRDGNVSLIIQNAFRSGIASCSSEGLVTPDATGFVGNVACFDRRGGVLVFAGQEPGSIAEIYLKDGSGLRAATSFNTGFLSSRFVSEAKRLPFTDRDGVAIDGWVLEPYGYDPAKKWPGVLEIHGGPRTTYSDIFVHEMQLLASEGYFVFFCNPRGSAGYGNDTADLRGRYGGPDFLDLMDFTDAVMRAYPALDENRLACAGGSYGGFMCNWIAGHTDRFAAIASMRSVSNWVSDFGTSEIGYTFDANEMGATPWTDMQAMWDQSPLKNADLATSPILFIHSMQDYNCTISQGMEMFTAMKYFNVESRMVLFEGENHNLSRNGKPRARQRRLKEILDWFAKWAKDIGREASLAKICR